ncbi:hypothetical protein ASPZODRAFT_17070 [Penicilliopsis zonata CBS 506.65]|uniref:Uncharacterized protein n=1 Tax=Penicilliopsis zonata CBS 506.65 TaxID=1073090 RepID=A0A1L9SEL7_9EURO|nr:hypothetical protein ASPZODRAFT_17070 [Penicilliopsis zonata CBS 506.65]OJJ45621.1 hypothetical protein ASPZODRAFT_17070 [Penicilliopsis zonata CBS 506.65]
MFGSYSSGTGALGGGRESGEQPTMRRRVRRNHPRAIDRFDAGPQEHESDLSNFATGVFRLQVALMFTCNFGSSNLALRLGYRPGHLATVEESRLDEALLYLWACAITRLFPPIHSFPQASLIAASTETDVSPSRTWHIGSLASVRMLNHAMASLGEVRGRMNAIRERQ